MKPGRELDALVAEKVMGINPLLFGSLVDYKMPNGSIVTLPYECKSYSTDIAAAWEVVEKLTQFKFKLDQDGFSSWNAFFLEEQEQDDGPAWHEDIEYEGNADTAPHAICLAALKAVGVDI
jgi:hypothetical protein